jgi:signal peptidase I
VITSKILVQPKTTRERGKNMTMKKEIIIGIAIIFTVSVTAFARVYTLQMRVTSLEEAKQSLEANLLSVNASVVGLQNTLSDLETAIGVKTDSLNDSIITFQSDLEGASADITELQLNIDTLASEISNYGTSILELQSRITSLSALLMELQDRVYTLKGEEVKTIRFSIPVETILEIPVYDPLKWTEWENTSEVFTWIPVNTSYNAVISVYWWFDYKANITIPKGTPEHYINVGLNFTFNDAHALSNCLLSSDRIQFDTFYKQSGVIPSDYASDRALLPKTNCTQYNFQFKIQGYAYTQSFKAYVKNLNAIVTVVDGLPKSN